jgi:hypothetical protein
MPPCVRLSSLPGLGEMPGVGAESVPGKYDHASTNQDGRVIIGIRPASLEEEVSVSRAAPRLSAAGVGHTPLMISVQRLRRCA